MNAFNFSKEEFLSLLRSCGVAAMGAIATYLLQWASNTDFGTYTPIVMALATVISNVVRKKVTGE